MPFSLTPAFRSMLQRGVEISTLDMAYVSSLSWYFLTYFGLRGLMSILLEDGEQFHKKKTECIRTENVKNYF